MLVIVSSLTSAQKKQFSGPELPHPTDSGAAIPRFPVHVSDMPKARIDSAQLQRDARELLELSQSLQPDIDNVNQGLLHKDTVEKLKRIEKLSKRLRSQLAP